MEDALGVSIPEEIRALRRLIYCGEWLESHSLHVYMLHAPDFLGYESAFAMAREHGEIVERGLRTKKVGNELIAAIGGREIHPINVRVGGFYRAPDRRDLEPLRDQLARAREEAAETVRWTASLPFPELEPDYEFVALRSPVEEYPIDRGRIVSSRGIDVEAAGFDETFEEEQVPHSNALHCRVRGRGSYLAGPMARFNLNLDRLSPPARQAAEEAGIGSGCRNPFQSIVVRAVEILYACDEALRLIDAYEPPDPPAMEPEPRAAVGHGVTEAPRGLLYHRYELGEEGEIRTARIVPPDLAEPAHDRGGPPRIRAAQPRARRRGADPALRADDPQLRPLHLVRHALPAARGRPRVRVIGIGNPLRGDDAVGLLVARRVRELAGPEVEVMELEGEPSRLIDAWQGARLVVVVDAVKSGAAEGAVMRFDATAEPLPPPCRSPPRTPSASATRSRSLARWTGCPSA